MNQQEKHPFIKYLSSMAKTNDRGALAALRRGLGQPPGTVTETYRYVEPWLPEKRSPTQEVAFYLVATLFAFHPKETQQGNMGGHLAQARTEASEDALSRRFTALLAAHPDDLPVYLRQTVSFLKSKEIAVNWEQLLRDLQNWDHQERFVQKRWAHAFWGAATREKSPEEPINHESTNENNP